MKKKNEPGEWKTDKFGKRYREVGPGLIEYEETVMTTAGEMTTQQLEAFHAHRKAAEKTPAEMIAEHEELERLGDRRICPFSQTANKCSRDCAFRLNGTCSIAVIAERFPPLPPEEMTSGKGRCPINRHKCDPDCAWCVHGACAIKKIAKGSMTNE